MINKILKGGLLTALLFAGTTAFAQSGKDKTEPKQTVEQKADKQVARMDSSLSLTAQQEAAIKAIKVKYLNQKIEDRKNSGNDEAKMKALGKTRNDAERKEILAVLTPEQTKLWKEVKANHKEEKGKTKGKPVEKDKK